LQRRQASQVRDIKSSIDQLVAGLGIRQKIAEYDAVLRWDTIVGEHIARAATAVKIVKGVLFVRVKSSTWRNELTIRKRDIINSLNSALGEDLVKDIRFQ
jgi:predicted nucleic acid-binding Zn ribbon protein